VEVNRQRRLCFQVGGRGEDRSSDVDGASGDADSCNAGVFRPPPLAEVSPLRAKLKERGLEDNSIALHATDNGDATRPWPHGAWRGVHDMR